MARTHRVNLTKPNHNHLAVQAPATNQPLKTQDCCAPMLPTSSTVSGYISGLSIQTRWKHRLCHRHVDLPRYTLPSAQAFVTSGVTGMGQGLHPQTPIAAHLENGLLIELVPDTPLDVPLHWQQARSASSLLDGLTREIFSVVRTALNQK